MSERPYVTLSCAMSIDGYLDGAEPGRLAMSNAADLDRVDAVRAQNDAIMVGASTVRRDDPRLLVKSAERRRQRESAGLTAVADEGDRDIAPANCRSTPSSSRPAMCRASSTARQARARAVADPDRQPRERRAASATGSPCRRVLDDLAGERGIRRLMVEGGGTLLTQFLADDLADELHLVIAPFFVGEPGRPGSWRPRAFRGRRPGERNWQTPARSATSCCCATRCRAGSPAPLRRTCRRSRCTPVSRSRSAGGGRAAAGRGPARAGRDRPLHSALAPALVRPCRANPSW